MDSPIVLNAHGVNKAIKAHILSDEQMKNAGFAYFKYTNPPWWGYNKMLKLPAEFKNTEISFSVDIPVDGSDIWIDVLDDDFLQPYDYQHFLETNPKNKLAQLVKKQVEEQMQRLQDAGVLSGHNYGEYIWGKQSHEYLSWN